MLSVLALRTASANFPIFGTKDLVRLAIIVACLILSTNARNIRLVSLLQKIQLLCYVSLCRVVVVVATQCEDHLAIQRLYIYTTT